MPAIKKDATIQDIVKAMVDVYTNSENKSHDQIVEIIMDILYDYINLDSDNKEQNQLEALKKLLNSCDNLSIFQTFMITKNATGLIALKDNSILNQFIGMIISKGSIDERAKLMLGHIKVNSPKAQLDSPVVIEDSASTQFDFFNIVSQEHKNRKLVGDLYLKSLNELFDYCAFLQKTIQHLSLGVFKKSINKDITDVYDEILKFKQNFLDPEHPMDIKEFLNCSTKAVNLSYQIEEVINIKIAHEEKDTSEVSSAKLKSFSKENITYAMRVIDAISNLVNFLFTLKEKIKKHFIGESPAKLDEKKLMMFRQITGLSKSDAEQLDDLHYKVRDNAMGLKGKLGDLK